jgi:hypothetical protein
MRPSPLLLALATSAAALACGGNSSNSGKCTATSCPTGQTCQADGTCVTLATPDGGIAACTAGDVKPVGDSVLPDEGSQPAGTAFVIKKREPHKVGDVMTFAVPTGMASVTIVEQATKAPDTTTVMISGSAYVFDNTAVPHTVQSPAPAFVINFNDIDNGQTIQPDYTIFSAYFFSDSPATGTLTIPNTTKGLSIVRAGGGLPSGTWTAQISDYAYECAAGIGAGKTFDTCVSGALDSTYDVTVIVKPVSGGAIPAGGTLDVVLNFVATTVGGQALNAAAAPTDPDVQRMVTTLQGFYSKTNPNITVNVTYRDAPSDVQQRYATGVNIDQIGACSDLSQLLIHGDTTKNALNIFLVPTLVETTAMGTAETVGIDGTIPGPASIPGTVASGAVVSVADLRNGTGTPRCTGSPEVAGGCGADVTAYIIAHEAGHFLGLYHVTEKYGFEFDPLAGTPTCKCATCKTNPSLTCADPAQVTPPSSADTMTVSECLGTPSGCGGGDNLMFWLLATGSQGNLLDEQGQVMRANPAVH